MAQTNPIPEGYPVVTAHLCVERASEAIEFYRAFLGATERLRLASVDGKVRHAELAIGDSVIVVWDEDPKMRAHSARHFGGSPVAMVVYIGRAVAAGARVLQRVENRFYGNRFGWIEDPFGHTWIVATHVEDVSPAELARRAAEEMTWQ